MSFFVTLELPKNIGNEAREAFSVLVPRLAGLFSFQGLEDWSVDIKNSRVLGAESEFHDLRKAGSINREMRVYFSKEGCAEKFAKALSSVVGDIEISKPRKQAVRDWMKLWRKHYKTQTLREGPCSLHIVPAWKKCPRSGTSVRITPGQAFGTGTHPTTQLCLRLFMKHLKGKTVLDFGAGTGVLAIAAAKENFRGLAVESDPVALDQCRKNIRLNRVKMATAAKLPSSSGGFDLVFANVLSPVLLDFRERLLRKVRKNGVIFLSGILAKEASVFLKQFYRADLELLEILEQGDWAAIALKKMV